MPGEGIRATASYLIAGPPDPRPAIIFVPKNNQKMLLSSVSPAGPGYRRRPRAAFFGQLHPKPSYIII